MKPNPKIVGERIRVFRKRLGLTMQELGEKFDTPRGTINNWEKGTSLPSKERIATLAELFGISESELLYGSMESFLKELFQYPALQIQGVDLAFFRKLETEISKRKLGYQNVKEIIELAPEVEPIMFGDENYYQLLEIHNIRKFETKKYKIESDDAYRVKVLPYINEILTKGTMNEESFRMIREFLMFLRFSVQIESTKEFKKLGLQDFSDIFDPGETIETTQHFVNSYGSRLIKEMFRHLDSESKEEILKELPKITK